MAVKTNPFINRKKPIKDRNPSLWISGKVVDICEDGLWIEEPQGQRTIKSESLGDVIIKPWSVKLNLGNNFINNNLETLQNLKCNEIYNFVVSCGISKSPDENNEFNVVYWIRYISNRKSNGKDVSITDEVII